MLVGALEARTAGLSVANAAGAVGISADDADVLLDDESLTALTEAVGTAVGACSNSGKLVGALGAGDVGRRRDALAATAAVVG